MRGRSRSLSVASRPVATMSTVTAMHEDMHAHADQERQPKHPVAGEDMDPVLVAEQQSTHRQCDDEIDASA